MVSLGRLILSAYGRAVRAPVLGPLVRLPVRMAKAVIGVPSPSDRRIQLVMAAADAMRGDIDSLRAHIGALDERQERTSDTRSHLVMAAADAMRGDIDRLLARVEDLEASQERTRLTVAMLCGRLERVTADGVDRASLDAIEARLDAIESRRVPGQAGGRPERTATTIADPAMNGGNGARRRS